MPRWALQFKRSAVSVGRSGLSDQTLERSWPCQGRLLREASGSKQNYNCPRQDRKLLTKSVLRLNWGTSCRDQQYDLFVFNS